MTPMLALLTEVSIVKDDMSTTAKNVITTICLIGSALMILDTLNAGDALTYFLLAGVIPGTSIILNSTDLLMMYTIIFGFITARFMMAVLRRFGTIRKRA